MSQLSRRGFLQSAAATVLARPLRGQSRNGAFVYVATNTGQMGLGEGNGIHAFRLVGGSTLVEFSGTLGEVPNANSLAVHPNRKVVYAVHNGVGGDGRPVGTVAALAVNSETGALTLMNRRSTMGANPVHVSVDPTGRFVLVANYDTGNVAVFPVAGDGSLGAASDVVMQSGKAGPHPRQDGPHPRQIQTDPTGNFAIVCDLGLDTVFVYRLLGDGTLRAHSQTAVEAGAGPRNIAYHPLGRWLYRINELNNTMTAMEWMAAAGELRNIQSLPTVSGNVAENNTGAVMVAPYGQFVYGSNLGDDSIVLFNMDAGTGEMTYLDTARSEGSSPLSFGIDPGGDFLVAANQASNNVTAFSINRRTGRLTAAGKLDLPSPANVTFLSEAVGVDARSGVTLSVFNNPTYIFDGTGLVRSSIAWNAPGVQEVDVRVNAVDGPSLGRFAGAGGVTADKWVGDGTMFFVQDVSGGKPLTRDNTLGTVRVTVRTEV